MPLLRTTPFVQLLLHTDTSWPFFFLLGLSSFNFFRILYQTHLPVYTTSPASQPLVLYHLQITAVYLKPATIRTQQLQPFPKRPNIHLLNHTSHISFKQPWRHHTTLSQSNITRKPFTHIISHPDTRPTIYIKTLHCFQ